MIINFSHPAYLLGLFAIPVILFIHFFSIKNKKKVALKFANFSAISRIRGVDVFSKNIVNLILSSAILLLLVLSISGANLQVTKQTSSFSFVFAIDNSRSMKANDFLPDRLSAAKTSAKEIIDSIPSPSRIGVVSFSGNTFIERDLTESKDDLRVAIYGIDISQIEGTDINEVVVTSTNMLKGEDAGAIVILSDGQANTNDLNRAISYAVENNVIINTIAIGTETGGQTDFGISKLDEEALKALAYNTGGNFFNATNEQDLLSSFRDAINITRKKVTLDISAYLLVIAILLFLALYFLSNTRYTSFP